MRILVDTHIVIWCDRRPRAVPGTMMPALRDTENEVLVSVASVWEIAIKRASGRLDFGSPIAEAVRRLGFELLPITAEHAEHAGALPRHHNDPFDRLIVAQAYLEGLTLATTDRLLRPYGVSTLGLD